MGFFNKVKNIFFEEEIVEVEEKPKKVKKEVPVAKKIELPKAEKKEKKTDDFGDEVIEIDKEPIEEKENKFPMNFDEDDFKEDEKKQENVQTDNVPRRSERRKTDKVEKKIDTKKEEQEEAAVVQNEIKYDFEDEYGIKKESSSHGLYEGKSNKKAFTPTPIISPIYGILDKNYKKDEIVTKKEIILSSAPQKIDLDTVREKAYGDLSSNISQSMEKQSYDDEDNFDLDDSDDIDDALYDLNDESSSPAVKKVTVGDAEEYFNELGLEYNIDYKDTSLEKERNQDKKRRTTTKTDKEEEQLENKVDSDEEDDGLESNLFDLIESMYDEKE